MSAELLSALRREFGLESFRPGQEEVVGSVLGGRPTIAVFPTGAGKSLCYQLPALLCEGTAVVVSPLIALMKDQVDALRALGISAGRITSADDPAERRQTLSDLRAGTLKLVYVAPERFRSAAFVETLQRLELSLFAVDEAHCVSEWGHDFRPDYRALRGVIERLRPPRLAAFTATATPEVRDELGSALGMEDPALFVRGFNRPNIFLRVVKARGERDKIERLHGLLAGRTDPAAVLIYAGTRRSAENAAEALTASGLRARHYHAGCSPEDRHAAQEAFLADELDALVATNAFGMGVDKPDIRLLVHLAMPKSVEAYYQEVGRAGRDGGPAEAVLLFNHGDTRTAEFLIRRSAEEEDAYAAEHMPLDDLARQARTESDLRRLRRMTRYASGTDCRRRFVLGYFGDPDAIRMEAGCGSCDRCEAGASAGRRALDDEESLVVRKALAGVARTHGRYGRARVAGMLAGRNRAEIRQAGLDGLSTFGLLRAEGEPFVKDLLESLEEAGLVSTVGAEYPLLALTELGNEVMQEREQAEIAWPESQPPRTAAPRSRSRRSSSATADSTVELDADPELYQRLAAWRRSESEKLGKPAYVVFSNATLAGIAAARPLSLDELGAVHGVGPAKLAAHGEAVLALVRGDSEVGFDASD